MSTERILFVLDIVGLVAFALSGAIMAIKKGLDLFGVNILAIITSVGGGCIRDLMLGSTPPLMLKRPVYIVVSCICATVVFIIMYFHLGGESNNKKAIEFYDIVIFIFDTLGLASFTIDGMISAYSSLSEPSIFIVVFMGVLTGIGGGVLRDITLQRLPFVFVKHIYALASMTGAIVSAVLIKYVDTNLGLITGFAVIVIIRLLAAKFEWNLPTVKF